MIPKGALIGLCFGIIIAAIFGIFLSSMTDQAPALVYVDGPSLSIIAEKINYKIGEDITIKIVNSGTTPLTFSDSSYGLRVIGLDGRILYSPQSKQVISILQPKEEKMFVWDQTKSDGEKVIDGRYKIVSKTMQNNGKMLEKSITINIFK
ncbi:MAG TPA: hypothetical protein VD699_06820 [Nitrosopumilaceae archaeon]|nr:hypothetical protein [Nitrosopumilaceae archaeon]